MGNAFTCFSQPSEKPLISVDPPPWISTITSSPSSSINKNTDKIFDKSYIKQQAEIATMLYHHHLNNNNDLLLHLNRSVSTKNSAQKKHKNSSMRSRSVSSSSHHQSSQLLNIHQDLSVLEKRHFVLVHGGGFGAWCWYKIITHLKDSNCEVDAVDLAGSGANICDLNSITTIAQFAKPLIDLFINLEDGEKVILVGHDIGGACISYAMELFPTKVSRAIFVAATMMSSGQSALDVFSQQHLLSELNQQSQKFLYGNGKDKPPTAIEYEKSLLEDFLFNRSSSKDIALASVSMRTIPFAPLKEKLSFSKFSYGSIPRYYIKTEEDQAIPMALQEYMIESNPPAQTFQLNRCDHSPFFLETAGIAKTFNPYIKPPIAVNLRNKHYIILKNGVNAH